jgi:hypothetical protein
MMTTREAAIYLGLSVYYLRNMRHGIHNHKGPEFMVFKRREGMRGGMAYYYHMEELDKWNRLHKRRKVK